jgi:hypothetical protein
MERTFTRSLPSRPSQASSQYSVAGQTHPKSAPMMSEHCERTRKGRNGAILDRRTLNPQYEISPDQPDPPSWAHAPPAPASNQHIIDNCLLS